LELIAMNEGVDRVSGLARLTKWFTDEALPFWVTIGFDGHNGHFVEGLALDGTPETSGQLRTRSAARQIYVFAHSASLGVAPPDGLSKAETAFANLWKCAWIAGERPGYARSFNRFTGQVTDPSRDLYDHACVLLALAWLLKATGKDMYRTHIAETLYAVDVTLAASHGGWAEDSESTTPRRQNPHMHFFEACLALVEVTGEPAHIARAGELFGLFKSSLYDARIQALREYFGPAWEVGDAHGSGNLDPGHMAEWVWLLRRYATLASADVNRFCANLLHAAQTLGADSQSCFLVDEVSEQGTILKSSRRLWPQAEFTKALVAQYMATGDSVHLNHANRVSSELFKTYLAETPTTGTWRDCFDLEGQSISTTIPSSSHYHLWTAVAELLTNQNSINPTSFKRAYSK
jgi:mannose/cellobiose epimerase-like protein (N-acyl-D-glucosamine 2-epimerase family)